MKKILIAPIVIFSLFVLGAGCTQSKTSVNYIQQKNVTSNAYFVMAEGAMFRGIGDMDGVDIVRVDCDLQGKACVENGFGLTKNGVTVLYNSKTYTIVESTASRVVGEYEGLAQTHHVEINLLTRLFGHSYGYRLNLPQWNRMATL